MKKSIKITLIAFSSLLAVLIALLILVPVLFKDRIKAEIEKQADDMLNARVTFNDYSLSLIKSFPNASFSLDGLAVTGVEKFSSDTLAQVRSFRLVFNLASIFSNSGYEIRSVTLEKPVIKAVVLADGSANWDIMKETPPEEGKPAEEEASSFRLKLKQFVVSDGKVTYIDRESSLLFTAEKMSLVLTGDLDASRTLLTFDVTSPSADLEMDNVRYLSGARLDLHSTVDAQLDSMRFVLKDNVLSVNDLKVNLSGVAEMPGDDIYTDISFNAPETSFKTLLSLIPAFYMEGYENLKAEGSFSLSGKIKGTYSDADSTMPDVSVNLAIKDGSVSYPDLPDKITLINVLGELYFDGKNTDGSLVDIRKFHFELAGNPFDMTLKLANPVSDPAVEGTAQGIIDLDRLSRVIPSDSLDLNGILNASLAFAGRMSAIEKEKYDQFKAEGSISLTDMLYSQQGLPEVRIKKASLGFSPSRASLSQLDMNVGKRSDISASGTIENYLPYIFSDGIIKGTLDIRSGMLDLNEIMGSLGSDSVPEDDSLSVSTVMLPRNIDFTLSAYIARLAYGKLNATDVKGNFKIKDGVLTARETGMKAIGGTIVMNAGYDTRDTIKPKVTADLTVSSVGIREAFNAFNTVQKLAPAASGLGGNVSMKFSYSSLLGKSFMPVVSTIDGKGEVSSESVQLVESKTFDQVKGLLKLNEGYSNTVRDLKASFTVSNGRVYVKPFDTKLGNIKLNISGDQGMDQTINYLIKTEIPRAELGSGANALMSSISAQAGMLGINFAPPEVIKINLKVGGTFSRPVVTPVTGTGEGGTPAQSVATAVKEQATESASTAARQQADRLIAEAELQAKAVKDEAAVAAKKIRDEAEVQAQKLITDSQSKNTLAQAAAKKGADLLRKEADRQAAQLEQEAARKADRIIADARAKADELLK